MPHNLHEPVTLNDDSYSQILSTRDGVEVLHDLLSKEHPDYKKWKENWETYADVLGDTEVEKEKYLPRGLSENKGLYRLRVRLSQFIPESQLAVQKLLGALFNRNPRRDGIPASLDQFMQDSDFRGHHWNKVIEEIAHQLLGYGTTRILVNINRTGEGIPLTRADEQQRNIRPYVVLYSPLSVIDWEADEFGQLNMVRLKETRTVSNQPTKYNPEAHATKTRFVQYDRQSARWWEFTENDKGKKRVSDQGSSRHDLGVVPMVVEYFPKAVKPMVGSSFIRYAAKADIQKFQAESDLAYDTHVHAHPIFFAKVNEDLAAVGIGSQSFIKLDPQGDEEIGYVPAPTPAFDALQSVIEEKRAMIYRQANIDPMGVADAGSSQMQGSGTSRAWSYGTSEARMLSQIADTMEKVERRVFDMALRFITADADTDSTLFEGEIQYPEEFDIASTESLLMQTQGVGAQINSETLAKTLQGRVAASLVGDVTTKRLEGIIDEIEANPLIGDSEMVEQEGTTSMPTAGDAGEVELGTKQAELEQQKDQRPIVQEQAREQVEQHEMQKEQHEMAKEQHQLQMAQQQMQMQQAMMGGEEQGGAPGAPEAPGAPAAAQPAAPGQPQAPRKAKMAGVAKKKTGQTPAEKESRSMGVTKQQIDRQREGSNLPGRKPTTRK